MNKDSIQPQGKELPPTGLELIIKERERQIKEERFTANHDSDQFHENGELALFACCYASPKLLFTKEEHNNDSIVFRDPYPENWDKEWDRRERNGDEEDLIPNEELPVKQRIRNLVKAGALIAAEIDRLQRLQK